MESAQGCNCNFSTSESDGSNNWQIICDTITDEDVQGNYPAFEYCNNLTDGNKNWYLPAIDEVLKINECSGEIDACIEEIKTAGFNADKLWYSLYAYGLWSSSNASDTKTWVSYNYKKQNENKSTNTYYYVRGVTKF